MADEASPNPMPGRAWSTWMGASVAVNAVLLLVWSGQRCFGAELRALVTTIPDDSFYYLLPAFRFREHGFWTFDGLHPTFGVQPVYAWFLTGLGALFDDRFAFFRAALWANYVCFAATGVGIGLFLHRLLRPCGERRATVAAVVAAQGFFLNGTLVNGYTLLKENALYALLLIASMALALRASRKESRAALFQFGALSGLAFSCRLTPSTLFVALTLTLFAARGVARARLLPIAAGTLAVVLPWVLHTLSVYGRVLPTSGSVKTQPFVEALRHGQLGSHLPALLAGVGPYLRDAFAYSLGQPHGFSLPQGAPHTSLVTVLFPWLLLGLVLAGQRRHALRACPGALVVPVALVAATLGAALNPVLLGVERMQEVRHYYVWYIADLPVLLAALAPLSLCFVAPAASARSPRTRLLLDGLGALLAAGCVTAGVTALRPLRALSEFRPRPDSWSTQAVAIAERANELLPPEARIGAFNAGVLGFLADATVVNFDGLANDDILAARARGATILEYVRANGIEYVADPLRPTGWFGNPFDRLAFHAAVPFRVEASTEPRPYYDGYFLLRVVDERFPDFDPPVEGGGVSVVPWLAVDPLGSPGAALRCFRFEPRGAPAVATFRTLRAYSALHFRAGAQLSTTTLTVLDEQGRVLSQSTPGAAEVLTVPCRGADSIRAEVTAEQTGEFGAVAWLTDLTFDWAPTTASPDEAPIQAYGEGCDLRASSGSPLLEALGDPASGQLRYVVTQAPARSAGTLAIGATPISKALPGGCHALVERTSSTLLIEIRTDETGRAEHALTIPADAPAGFSYAQVVFRSSQDPRSFSATTNGVRVRVGR